MNVSRVKLTCKSKTGREKKNTRNTKGNVEKYQYSVEYRTKNYTHSYA